MKALSIKQPWASLIAHGIKDIENRTWKTKFRGRIYIHASADLKLLKKTGNELYTKEQWLATPARLISVSSAIIGEVDIVDCVMNHESIWAEQTCQSLLSDEYIEKPIYNWVLANAKLYDKPILNVKGKLSFWYPDTDIVECIGCSQKFDSETMEDDDGGEKFCTECWEVLSPIMIQETKECNDRDKLSEFGKVVTLCQSVFNYEFLITDGFSGKATNTFACMEVCMKIAEGYPYVKKCITEDNKFHLILTKEKK
ncbi:ASCH domain-containing protein [Flavobacterium sp. LB2P84]|uniref:ASCH domain-containing protein n=1 Tax=Flavobacterium yafengii TaxID=3041253 RepID=UPI0024A7CB39|nr:ASCH domain-containing protein [Flavobacterium yafengii]MDI6033999.1 ASCH domain-containing protein [Flavobacterium yafengii]